MLKYGLAVVLMFVGLKIAWLNDLYNGKFPITISLGIIAAVITISVIASLLFPRVREAAGASASPGVH
jgi:tellurite resistance protein TerC